MTPLELDRPRNLGDLVTLSFNVFTRHFTPLFTLAMIVVTPYVLLIDGVWGRALAEGADARQNNGPTAVYVIVGFLVVQPLMAATVTRSRSSTASTVNVAARIASSSACVGPSPSPSSAGSSSQAATSTSRQLSMRASSLHRRPSSGRV